MCIVLFLPKINGENVVFCFKQFNRYFPLNRKYIAM